MFVPQPLTHPGTYLPFIIWDLGATAAWYFLAVETKGHSRESSYPICLSLGLADAVTDVVVEEINEFFQARNPVKASLAAHKDRGTVAPAIAA